MTEYSKIQPGDRENFGRGARFDWTAGCLGITAREGEKWTDRVLLSPAQVTALLAFVAQHRRKRRA